MIRMTNSIRPLAGPGVISLAAMFSMLIPGWRLLAEDASGKLPLSAPVKVLEAQPAAARPPGQSPAPQAEQPSQPTLPNGKLPQYRWAEDEVASVSSERQQDAKLRFQLALPSRPILIEAVVTIDGRPYRMARERRIEEIIKAATAERLEVAAEGAAQPADATAPDAVADEAGEEADASQPSTRPYSPASHAAEFVRRYASATGRQPTPEEVRWILAERIDGPVLLLLHDNFQRFRANQRPAFDVLDRDRDGVISPAELKLAVASFQECDFNRDGIVDYAEIARAANDPRLARADQPPAGKLIRRPTDTAATPDLTLAVSFHASEPARSTIAITATGGQLSGAVAAEIVNGNTITLSLADAILTFSAVQGAGSDQISLGAVNDGYPLLPALDPNDDGRFTVRELRELVDRLRQFDRNQDGAITADEIPPTIRVCFGLGPLVHRELAGIRSVNPPSAPSAVQAPAWFARMDRNKDNDLTRDEFIGTDDQFQALDADRDGLVSAQEAADFESRLQSPP